MGVVFLAAAVIQGLNFESRLISGAHEVYTPATGQKKAVIFLAKLCKEFTTFTDNIEAQITRGSVPCGFAATTFNSQIEKVQDVTTNVLLRLYREARDIKLSPTRRPTNSMEIVAAGASGYAMASSTEQISRSIVAKLHFKDDENPRRSYTQGLR
jgi:hypothetical protein